MLGESVKPAVSIAEHLRASHQKALQRTTVDIEMPDFDGLHVVFRALDDYRDVRNIVMEVGKRGLGDTDAEIENAIEVLLASAVGSYAVIDGDHHDLGLKLGLQLYDYIYPPLNPEDADEMAKRPQTDAEALLLLFRGTTAIVMLATSLQEFFGAAGIKTDLEQGKNF